MSHYNYRQLLKAVSILPYSLVLPINGLYTLFIIFYLLHHLLPTDFLYILLSPFHFILLYLSNILLFKSFFFHIYISNQHACASMSSDFFLRTIYNDSIFRVCISLFFYIWVQTLYDIDVYIWNMQYFLFHFSCKKLLNLFW